MSETSIQSDEERAAHLESHLGALEGWNPEHRVAVIEAELAAVRAEATLAERERCIRVVDGHVSEAIGARIAAALKGNGEGKWEVIAEIALAVFIIAVLTVLIEGHGK